MLLHDIISKPLTFFILHGRHYESTITTCDCTHSCMFVDVTFSDLILSLASLVPHLMSIHVEKSESDII